MVGRSSKKEPLGPVRLGGCTSPYLVLNHHQQHLQWLRQYQRVPFSIIVPTSTYGPTTHGIPASTHMMSGTPPVTREMKSGNKAPQRSIAKSGPPDAPAIKLRVRAHAPAYTVPMTRSAPCWHWICEFHICAQYVTGTINRVAVDYWLVLYPKTVYFFILCSLFIDHPPIEYLTWELEGKVLIFFILNGCNYFFLLSRCKFPKTVTQTRL